MSNKKNQQEIPKHKPKQPISNQKEIKTTILLKQVFTQLLIPISSQRIYSIINLEISNNIILIVQILTSIKVFKSLLRVLNLTRTKNKLNSLKLM